MNFFNVQGLWVPGEVAFNQELNNDDFFIFTLIDMLDKKDGNGCSPSNDYIANKIGKSKITVIRSINKLVDLKYIIRVLEKSLETKTQIRKLYINTDYKKIHAHHISIFNVKNTNRLLQYASTRENKYQDTDLNRGGIKNDMGGIKNDMGGIKNETHSTYNKLKLNNKLNNKLKLKLKLKRSFSNSNELEKRTVGFLRKRKKIRLPIDLNDKNEYDKSSNDTSNKPNLESRERMKSIVEMEYKKKNKSLNYKDASRETRMIVDFWNERKIGIRHRLNSKTVENAMFVIENDVRARYGISELISAMRLYAKNNEFGKKVSLHEFFVGNKFKKNTSPLFKKFLVNDKFEDTTNELKRIYKKLVLSDNSTKFTIEQHLKFVEAAKRMEKFFKQKQVKKYVINADLTDRVLILFEALKNKNKTYTDIYPGNLCSNYTWEELLPRYLQKYYKPKTGLIEDNENYTIVYE